MHLRGKSGVYLYKAAAQLPHRARNVPSTGLYPVSANVPLGAQTGAMAHTPVADGVSPSAGRRERTDGSSQFRWRGWTIISRPFEHCLIKKFHPSAALSGPKRAPKIAGLDPFLFLIRKGSHIQFNVVSRETLLDAQKHPEQYKASGCTCGRIQRIVYDIVEITAGRHYQKNRAGILTGRKQEAWKTIGKRKGRIFDIQRYSIHDGDRIRTIVF